MTKRSPLRSTEPVHAHWVRFPSPWRHLTQVAFALGLAIVIARLTTVEMLRDPWPIVPGAEAVPRGPGPATGLVLDLLSLLPAILVLARAAVDRDFQLACRWSFVSMFALGAWAVISTKWADDKFAAVVTGSHLLASFCLLWAFAQLVRDWTRFRVVAGIAFGLLLVLVAQSVIYRAIDVPENARFWNENKVKLLKDRNWEPESFAAQQFERKLLNGELVGFFSSANTFAAVGVLLFFVSAGIGIQKIKDGEPAGWLLLPAVAATSLAWILIEARSKTSIATPVLGIAMFSGIFMLRDKLRERTVLHYWISVTAVFLVLLAVVGHGLYHHGLFPGHFSNSLQFRWEYWIASTHLFMQHPITGVGWYNFGQHYLAYRLPSASEEIKDPHNFLVRVFVELGAVGGALLILWMLRWWWEVTRPWPIPTADDPYRTRSIPSTILLVTGITVLGTLLAIIANIDFAQMGADIMLETLRRVLYFLVLVLAAIASCMLNPHQRELDARPAPWIFYGVLIALGLFLIHNLIDFSLFETGPMFLFMMLTGSTLGIASPHQVSEESDSSRGWAVIALLVAVFGWLVAGIGFVAPIVIAEENAHDADEAIRLLDSKDPPQVEQVRLSKAIGGLQTALSDVPYNADYAFRLGRALLFAGKVGDAQAQLALATQLEPRMTDAYMLLANVEMSKPQPIASIVIENFDTVLTINPNDISLHEQYGQALEKLGVNAKAAEQYQKALNCDAALPDGEPRHLTAAQVAELREGIVRLQRNQLEDGG
jgi:O-antigen ligase/cytochrome c-type biogenesis protein CcmH/NrfG